MKSARLLLFAAAITLPVSSFAATGLFDQFVIINTGSQTYYDIGASTGNPDFQGSNLGTFNPGTGSTLSLGGQGKSFKNDSSDVTGMQLLYRIWQGTESGAFTPFSYAFQSNLGPPGDQQWGSDVAGANGTAFYTPGNLLSSLANGTYTLEVLSRITTNGVNTANPVNNDNGGANFEATFSVVPEPSRAMLGMLGLSGLLFRRRRA
jgi:MYXO-CTERM domain-containing protein